MVLHIQQTEKLLNIIHLHPTSLRLWQILVWLGQKFGRDVDLATSKGRLIDLRVTHQELAEVINTTRVSVTRILRQFKSEGILQWHQGRFVIYTQN